MAAKKKRNGDDDDDRKNPFSFPQRLHGFTDLKKCDLSSQRTHCVDDTRHIPVVYISKCKSKI